MGFIHSDGYPLINEEQKIRINLSRRARAVMADDMDIFNVAKASTFINTVFDNYKAESQASVSLYLAQKFIEFAQLFINSGLDPQSLKAAHSALMDNARESVLKTVKELISEKGEGTLYHINDKNVEYLLEDTEENQYYTTPGQYIRAVIEDYCTLPFIERERIYRKEIYDIVEKACREKRVLKIRGNYHGQDTLFYAYPYKIMADQFNSQAYLICYSRRADEPDKSKIVASFSMARMNTPTLLTKTFYLNKAEAAYIEEQALTNSPSYMLGRSEQIEVRLTAKGKLSYQSRLYSRPDKIEKLSHDDIYVFNCTPQQALNYFFPFGAEAEIIRPAEVREQFKRMYEEGLAKYQ